MNALELAGLLNELPDDMIVSANVHTYCAQPVSAAPVSTGTSIRRTAASGQPQDAVSVPRWITAAVLAACLTFAAGFGMLLLRGHQNDLTLQSSRDDVEEIITTAGTALTTTAAATQSVPTGQPASETQRGIVTQTTADGSAEQDTADTTGTTGTEPPAETTAVLTEEPEQSAYGLMIDGVFYQKGDFNMDGVIDLRDDYEMSALYNAAQQGSYQALAMRSEQLALGDIVDWAPMKTEYTGLDRTYLLPYDTNDSGMLRRYICVHHMDPSVTLEAFVHLSVAERIALMNDFYRQYKLVSVSVADGNEVFEGEIFPLDHADGLYDHFGGTYYLCGDINMNGALDEEDAVLAEQIYDSRGDAFPLTQLLLANITRTECRYDTDQNAYPHTEYLQITGAEKAELIRDYIRLRDMGTELPESLYDFYDKREAGAYDALLKQ